MLAPDTVYRHLRQYLQRHHMEIAPTDRVYAVLPADATGAATPKAVTKAHAPTEWQSERVLPR